MVKPTDAADTLVILTPERKPGCRQTAGQAWLRAVPPALRRACHHVVRIYPSAPRQCNWKLGALRLRDRQRRSGDLVTRSKAPNGSLDHLADPIRCVTIAIQVHGPSRHRRQPNRIRQQRRGGLHDNPRIRSDQCRHTCCDAFGSFGKGPFLNNLLISIDGCEGIVLGAASLMQQPNIYLDP